MLLWSVLRCAHSLAGDAPPLPPPAPEPAPGVQRTPSVKKPEDIQGMNFDAVHMALDPEKNALVLSGSAVVSYQGVKLEGDNIVLFRETKEIYAEGNLRLRIGESEISAEAAYIDSINDTGYLVDAVVRVSASEKERKKFGGMKSKQPERDTPEPAEKVTPAPAGTDKERPASFLRSRDPYGIYLDVADDPQARTNLIMKASRVVIHSREHLSGEHAFITNDDMVHPMYGVAAGELDYYMKDVPDPKNPGQTKLEPSQIVAHGATIEIYGVRLFPFPTVTYDFQNKNAFIQEHFGHSSLFGYFSLSRVGYGLGGDDTKLFDPQHIYFDFDERSARGPAAGFEMDWETGRRPVEDASNEDFARGMGHIRLYASDEIQTSVYDDILRARRELERRIEPKIDGFPFRSFDANLLFMKRRQLENAGPPDLDLITYRGNVRGMASLQQHQPLKRFAGIDNLQLDFKYERDSDRDFKQEYFPNNFMNENQPEALLSVRKASDNYSMELLYRGDTQNFDAAPARSAVDYGTFTNYEPALTYSLVTTPLCYGVYMDTELQAAHLKRDFDKAIYNQNSFESDRAYGIIDLSRPIKWGAVNFVPHVGGQQQVYDQFAGNSNGGPQGALTYGLDATSRFYGLFPDLENDALDVKGMRHIVETRVSYAGISDTETRATKLLDFDQIDNLTRQDKIEFAIGQVAQTHRTDSNGVTRTYNFAGLDMALDYFPNRRDENRLLDGYATDLFKLDEFFRVHDVLKITASQGFQLGTSQLQESNYGLEIDPHTRWKLRFEERFNYSNSNRAIVGSDQFRVTFGYRLSERWAMDLEEVEERRRALTVNHGKQIERLTLTRTYGALNAKFSYSKNVNTGNNSYYFTIQPTAVYRNVIVPSQDLLVPSAEVTGDGEAPEERNFDPFDLLKQRNKNKKKDNLGPGKSNENAPVPPPPPSDNDVPTPPPPDQKRASGPASHGVPSAASAAPPAGSFSDPGAERSRVDGDDWTATPASTR